MKVQIMPDGTVQPIMDESYWTKVYAGQIAAGLIMNPTGMPPKIPADDFVAWCDGVARQLARKMCKEGGE